MPRILSFSSWIPAVSDESLEVEMLGSDGRHDSLASDTQREGESSWADGELFRSEREYPVEEGQKMMNEAP